MARQDSRFGFGQFAGATGAIVLALSVTQPWLKLDLGAAFKEALSGNASAVPSQAANAILVTATHVPKDQVDSSPQVVALARTLGIEGTGMEQERYAAIALIVLAVIALIAVVRSVMAPTAWAARANAPFLALAGFGGLLVAALELWVLSPKPQAAMRPDVGLWMIVAGSVLLLLGALTLGNNRRRPFLDDFGDGPGARGFDNTEHLAYSHGAWVPRGAADTER